MNSTNITGLPKRLADAYFTGAFKLMLVTVAPTEANLDAWLFRSAVTNEVAAGGGYATGGIACTVTVGATDTSANQVGVSVANLPNAYPTSTISAVGAFLYKSIGSAATDELVCYIDFGAPVSSTGSTFGMTFSTPLYINRG